MWYFFKRRHPCQNDKHRFIIQTSCAVLFSLTAQAAHAQSIEIIAVSSPTSPESALSTLTVPVDHKIANFTAPPSVVPPARPLSKLQEDLPRQKSPEFNQHKEKTIYQIGEYLEQEIKFMWNLDDKTLLDIRLPEYALLSRQYQISNDTQWVHSFGWNKVPTYRLSSFDLNKQIDDSIDTEDALHLKTGFTTQYQPDLTFIGGVAYDLHLSKNRYQGIKPLTDRLSIGAAALYEVTPNHALEVGILYQMATNNDLALPFNFGKSEKRDQLLLGFSFAKKF